MPSYRYASLTRESTKMEMKTFFAIITRLSNQKATSRMIIATDNHCIPWLSNSCPR